MISSLEVNHAKFEFGNYSQILQENVLFENIGDFMKKTVHGWLPISFDLLEI